MYGPCVILNKIWCAARPVVGTFVILHIFMLLHNCLSSGIWRFPCMGDASCINPSPKRLAAYRAVCVQRAYHVYYGSCNYTSK